MTTINSKAVERLVAYMREEGEDEAADLIASQQARIAALVKGLERIELLSTNHGGWFENDAWKWGQMMGAEARALLNQEPSK